MEWKKGCLILGGIGVLFALLATGIVMVAMSLTSPAVKSAEAFLTLLGEQKTTPAYQSTAPAFQEKMDEKTFFGLVDEELKLTQFASASWSSRKVENGRASLEGTITTKAGDKIPISMTLIQVNKEWKVFAFSVPEAGVEENKPDESEKPAGAGKVPSEDELKKLATESLLEVNKAVTSQKFSSLYQSISQQWQEQTTAKKLKAAFQDLIDKEADFSGVADVEPVFDEEPAINSKGVLILSGHYPTKPAQVTFTLKYIEEDGEWKLIGIEVNLEGKPAEEAGPSPAGAEVPNEAQLKELVAATLLAFNQAVQAEDFSDFYGQIAKSWKRQTTAAKIQAEFQAFIDNEVDIGMISDFDPVYDPEPEIDSDGRLNVAGYYPTKPMRVNFELQYGLEAGEWKLTSIGVNLKKPK